MTRSLSQRPPVRTSLASATLLTLLLAPEQVLADGGHAVWLGEDGSGGDAAWAEERLAHALAEPSAPQAPHLVGHRALAQHLASRRAELPCLSESDACRQRALPSVLEQLDIRELVRI